MGPAFPVFELFWYTVRMNPNETVSPEAPASPVRPRQRITPHALLEAKRLSDPKIHPDGQRIAFVVTEADFEESEWVSHLWLTEFRLPDEEKENADTEPETRATETDSGEEEAEGASDDPTRQLTFSRDGETNPKWSPDGRYLAFLSERLDESEPIPDDEDDDPKDQVWILPIDGGEARKLTSAKEGVLHYEWLPDSSGVLFLAPEPRPRPVESVRKEERDRRKIDPIVENEDRLRRQFWRVEVEERKPKLLFTGDYGIQEFAVSPDGEQLCYATNYTGEWNDYHLIDLWILNLADGTTAKLIERPGGKADPRWSPDGTQLAFLSWLDPALSYSRESLFVVHAPGPNPPAPFPDSFVALTEKGAEGLGLLDLDYDIGEFVWSRHDGSLYAVAAVGTGSEIYRIGETRERLDLGGMAERSHLDADVGAKAIVYVQESAEALQELFLRDENGSVHPLTKLNAEFAESYRLPHQEVVSWTSPDGLPIEGVLTYPLDYTEGTVCPLIVQIHGGPKGRATHILRGYGMPSVWSAEGYAVLQPNFRGSEGYGNAFAIANRRDLGGGDFADIMAGVDWCLAKGIADPQRMGIMGGSYGGYMTNWAIGHTDRFKAAVSMFGIFHLQTDYSNSDLSRWDNDYLGAYYWEDPEIYRRLSPGSYIENIKTPTLILHGDDDNNTFISNSKELYQALRHRGVTTQFVHYPREGHGLREPNHRLDEIRRCLAWMDRYVRHGGQNPGVYRLGDKVPSPNGLLELCVTRVEIASFLGQSKPEPKSPEAQNVLLEIAFTLHHTDSRREAAPLTLALDTIRLENREAPSPTPLLPVGVPLDAAGGKVLVEGDYLRIALHPDPDSKELAMGCAAVFRVPKAGGDCLLRVADFPPVSVLWMAESEDNEEKDE